MSSPLEAMAQIRPVSSVEAAATALRQAISTGDLPPGERVKEIPVAERLGLSRGSVRDALRVLAEEGLVVLIPNQGATVASVSAQDLMELYAVRLSLGDLALRSIVHAGADLVEVDAHLADLKKAVNRRRTQQASEADFALQDALVRASGLERTSTIFARTTLQLRSAIAGVRFDFFPVLSAFYDENARVVDALHRADAAAASLAWHDKLETWVRDFVRHLDGEFDGVAWLEVYSPRS